MNLLTIFCIFIAIIGTVSARYVYEHGSDQELEDYQVPRHRVRRDYGCSVSSSNNYECNENCRNKFGCNWGQCEGFMGRKCRCRNADNSYC